MWLVGAVLAAAVGAMAGVPSGPCNPLVPERCGLPYPSDFWLRPNEDGSKNVTTLFTETFPKTNGGEVIEPGGWNGRDGWTPFPAVAAYLPNATLTGLPQLWDVGASVSGSSGSVLVDATVGQVVAHWVELDHSSDGWEGGKEYARMLLLWPAQRLEDGHRYVVAYRGVVDAKSQRVPASAAFSALRDGKKSSDPDVEAMRAHFEDFVFPTLAQVGVERSSLQLAWDFTVATEQETAGDMLRMRDAALPQTLAYTVTKVTEKPFAGAARMVEGTYQVPLYLNTAGPALDLRLFRDPKGKVTQNGNATANFLAILPESAVNGPVRVLNYGHGLFGSRDEIKTDYLVQEANEFGYALFATDWWGLCSEDEIVSGLMLAGNLSDFVMIPDRLHQGMLNQLLLMRLASTQFPSDPNFQLTTGTPALDPSRRSYYGNSLGGILGSVYMSLTTDVHRGVLGVPGGPFPLLLPRSVDFAALFDVLRLRFDDTLDRIFLMTVLGDRWSKLEPAGYMSHISRKAFPNTPNHTVLIHYGQGDAQVSWLGAKAIARSCGADMYDTNTRIGNTTLFGFPASSPSTVLNGSTHSLLQCWDFKVPLQNIPFTNNPPDKSTDTHEGPRRQHDAQQQTSLFFEHDIIRNTCNGTCNGTMSF